MSYQFCRAPQKNKAIGCGRQATKRYRLGKTRIKTMREICDPCLERLKNQIAGRDQIITKSIEETQ